MEYKIISGSVTEIRQCRMDISGRSLGKRRGVRVKGNSTLRKMEQNEREAALRLARIINCNFSTGDLWLTLRYSDDRLPADREAAKQDAKRFLRKCRDEMKKRGEALRFVITTSDTDSETGEEARLHHHIVMNAESWETVKRFWPEDEITYRRLDGRKDYTGIARYMIRNAPKGENEKKWSCSRGLKKPVYTAPVAIRERDSIQVPAGAVVKERKECIDEESGLHSRYVRFVKPRDMKRRAKSEVCRR